jgi:hypothetical protein
MKLMSLPLLLALAFIAASSASVRAQDHFDKTHPRRAEVNHRLDNQHNRVKNGVKDGDLTKKQAHQIKREDRHIRREERHMAAKDGGHISKADQAKLNRQENHVSRQINRDEARNKGAAPAPAAPAPAAPAPAAPPAGQ